MTAYLANQTVPDAQIQEWVEQFHRDGFLLLKNVLPPDWVEELKADLDTALVANNEEGDGIIRLLHQTVPDAQIQELVEQFHRDGCLLLKNVLPPDWVEELK